jgi:hypothetical protein
MEDQIDDLRSDVALLQKVVNDKIMYSRDEKLREYLSFELQDYLGAVEDSLNALMQKAEQLEHY